MGKEWVVRQLFFCFCLFFLYFPSSQQGVRSLSVCFLSVIDTCAAFERLMCTHKPGRWCFVAWWHGSTLDTSCVCFLGVFLFSFYLKEVLFISSIPSIDSSFIYPHISLTICTAACIDWLAFKLWLFIHLGVTSSCDVQTVTVPSTLCTYIPSSIHLFCYFFMSSWPPSPCPSKSQTLVGWIRCVRDN